MVRSCKKKTKARPWTRDDLLEALMCIKAGKLEIKDAARQYGISRATLYRQYQKFELAGGNFYVNLFRMRGAQPMLTKMEEDVLVKTIRDLREQGFTVTSSDIKRICFEYCASNGIPNPFNIEDRMASKDWYYGFSKRHPDLNILNSVKASASIASSVLFTSADKLPKSKQVKLTTTPKETMNPDRIPPKSPVHVLTTNASKVTSGKEEKQSMEVVGAALKGRKQKDGSVAAAPLKKPLKRLILTEPSVARGKKGKAILSHIPTDEEEEIDSKDLEEDDENERDMNLGEDDLEEVIQTEKTDEDNKDKEDEKEVEDEVEMDTKDEEPVEADKSDSDEEENEEGVPDDDNEGEVVEQKDANEDEEEGEKDEEGGDGDGEQENDPDSALITSCDESPKSKKLKLTPPKKERNQKQDDIGEVMQADTADVDDEDEEAVERCAPLENEDVRQEVKDEVEIDEDDEEQDETETSDSEEEEVEEEEAEGDDDEEEEVQEDDDDGGEKEEGDVDEEEDGAVVVTGKDDVVYDACM